MHPEDLLTLLDERGGPHIDGFRADGGRVIGFFCSYVPEELLNVDGLASFRMRSVGCPSSELADSYMGIFTCGYVRHCLEQGLEGGFDFLDGFVFAPGCDHLRRLHDNWEHLLKPPFLGLIDVPHLRDDDALDWYRDEIAALWEKIAAHFSLPPGAEAVRAGVKKTNRVRRLLARLDRARWQGPVRLSGHEMHALSLLAATHPKELVEPVLAGWLDRVRRREPLAGHRARVLLVGSHLDDPGFVRVLEETGARVVRDAYCCGFRDQEDEVDEDPGADPFATLARRYLDRLSCPRMYADFPRRRDRILEMADEARVDGVVLEHLAFCETWGIDGNELFRELRERGIPVLRLEREYRLGGEGQLRTRVQAFLESLDP